MAQLTFNIPDPVAQRVLDAFAAAHGYDAYLVSNPGTTKTQFLRISIINYVLSSVNAGEIPGIVLLAKKQAEDQIKTDIQIT